MFTSLITLRMILFNQWTKFIIMTFSQGDFIRSEKVELKKIILSETNFFTRKITHADFFFLKSSFKYKSFNPTVKMEPLLTNAYTRLDQKSKLFKTNLIAIGTKELLQRKIYFTKCHFFTKWHFEKFINRMEVMKWYGN